MPGVEVWRHPQQGSWRSSIRTLNTRDELDALIDADRSAWSRQARSCRGLNLPKQSQPSEVIAKLAHEQIYVTPRIGRIHRTSIMMNPMSIASR
jgi:hypothetical protein